MKPTLKTWAVIGVLAVAVAMLAGIGVLAHEQPTFWFDLPLTQTLQAHRSPPLDVLMGTVSWPGYPPQFMLMFAAVVIILWRARWRAEAVLMILTEFAVGLAGFGIKPLVDRPRPPDTLVWVAHHLNDPFSFPAGHVQTFIVIYAWIAFLAIARPIRRPVLRWAVVVSCVLLLAVVGISRMYLGEHWASDVIGAIFLGTVGLCAEIMAYEWLHALGAKGRRSSSESKASTASNHDRGDADARRRSAAADVAPRPGAG